MLNTLSIILNGTLNMVYNSISTGSDIINDRAFWIYLIITLFFVIIGSTAILSSDDPHLIIVVIFWILANVALLILVYHASINWGPGDPCLNKQICVIDSNSGCFNANNRVWLFVNIIFVILLVLSILWAGELHNQNTSPLRTMSGVLILLGALVLCGLASTDFTDTSFMYQVYNKAFWVAVAYIMIWFGLTLYVVLN